MTKIDPNNIPMTASAAEATQRRPPVVLLHGIQGTARTWDGVVPLIDQHHMAITPNLRGRADAYIPGNVEDYRIEAFASDLLNVLDAVDRAPIIVAWSMGVSVVLSTLENHPNLSLSGLVLVSGSACVGTEARWFQGRTMQAVAAEAQDRRKRLALVEAAESHAVAASWQHVQTKDFRHMLTTIDCPTLVIHGIDDDQCPIAHGRLIAEQIPRACLDEWADTRHNPMARDPARFAQAILAFAQTL